MTLLLIGLLGGLITGISPCVLPVLPIVFVSGGVEATAGKDGQAGTAGKAGKPGTASDVRRGSARPFLVVAGLVISFSLVTLLGTLLLDALPIPDDSLRGAGLAALVLVGVGLLCPPVQHLLERPFSRIRTRQVKRRSGGFLLGLALGAVYVPCAGPVLAAITVAGATGHIGIRTVGLTVAFAVGAAIPLLALALAGQRVSERVKVFRTHQRRVQIVAGVALIGLAAALTFNVTDVLQRSVPDYTASLNKDLNNTGVIRSAGSTASMALQDCEQDMTTTLVDCGPSPAVSGIQQWLNTPDGKPPATAGKVVLVDFWAYSCINCQRAIPHVEAWYRAYAPDGLQVIGVHTPEYAFERVPSNVAAGARRLGITYPVAIDNSYTTWNDFGNDSWPAEYLIDASGQVRHVAIGEGDYNISEALIRQLLNAAHPGVTLPPATDLPDTTPTDPDQTPETYLGTERDQAFVGGTLQGGTHNYSFPSSPLPSGAIGLAGTWTADEQELTAGSGAQIELNFFAGNVYLDVGGNGTLTVDFGGKTSTIQVSGAPDIYTVASLSPAGQGQVAIGLSPGLQAYSFTFG